MKLHQFRKFVTCLIVLTIAAVLFSSCSTVSKSTEATGNSIIEKIYADIITQPDITSLINISKIIISGKVLSVDPSVKVPIKFDFPDTVTKAEREKLENSEEGYHIFTVSEVEVSKVTKGDLKEGDVIKIYQLGGSSEEKIIELNRFDYFKQGDNHILFITDWDGKYCTVNPIQGDIKLVDKKSRVNEDNKLFQDGIAEDELISNIKAYVDKAKSSEKP
ncbi:MAG TPA: hypothetical protein VIK78_09375 [Ruminiclostridium sp.]